MALFALAISSTPARADVIPADAPIAAFSFRLATWSGPIETTHAKLAYDPSAKEVFVVDTRASAVRIFDERGMEVFRFGHDEAPGAIVGAAPLPSGDILTLAQTLSGEPLLERRSFRGELKATLPIDADPAQGAFRPTEILARAGRVYLFDPIGARLLVTDLAGRRERTVDLAAALGFTEAERRDISIANLTVDREGNLLFTIPTLFRVFVLSPKGEIRSFGRKGSSPGLFNVVTGIATDAEGTIYLTDILRSVVMVFDRDFEFRQEFGYRGPADDNLLAPNALVAGTGRVFVSNGGNRGVSVFELKAPKGREVALTKH